MHEGADNSLGPYWWCYLVAQDAADPSKASAELAAFLRPAAAQSGGTRQHIIHLPPQAPYTNMQISAQVATQHVCTPPSVLPQIGPRNQQLPSVLPTALSSYSLVCDKLQRAAKLLVVVRQPLQQRLLVLHLQLSTSLLVLNAEKRDKKSDMAGAQQ